MIPIVTPEEMAAIDAAAPEPTGVLVARAGAAVARAAMAMLGGTYGRRVVVVAGKGNNGNDGRAAAARLRRRGARVAVLDARAAPGRLPPSDLVVDAAYGTGFRGDYEAPDPAGAPVLAVDIPSGVAGLTGEAASGAVRATRTVTFAAYKPGLVVHPGAEHCGTVELADIGLDSSTATAHLVEPTDVAGWLPRRPADAHKWRAAVRLIGGSPGMRGAVGLAARGAFRAGAGYVRTGVPGDDSGGAGPIEAVGPVEAVADALPAEGWAGEVATGLDRFRSLVLGPGLGRGPATTTEVLELLDRCPVPAVVDGDGLHALAGGEGRAVLRRRGPDRPTVLTPHDGEYAAVAGEPPGPDRFAATRHLAADLGAVVLLKGPTTLCAAPDGAVLASTAGDERLATAGTGDVLAGVLGGLLAVGCPPLRAAAAAAHLHGAAGALGFRRGLVAGDLPRLLPRAVDALEM